jgi:V8-like Glu-specific endopeptidase
MKISVDKNLAFGDQPSPIPSREIEKLVKPRPPVKALAPSQLDITRFLSTKGAPKVQALTEEGNRSILRVSNFQVGHHALPPEIEATALAPLGPKSSSFARALTSDGYLPDHLALTPGTPGALPDNLRTPPFHVSRRLIRDGKNGNQATTVFPPENRAVFNDTSYPWGACGRVDSPLGQGSGAMVGPRHLLTVSHVVQWNSNNTAGWVRFRPGYFAPSAPFGDAWGTRVYFKQKVSGPTIDWIEGMNYYVCVVLDRPIGNWTGWLGAKGYTDSWDGGAYWSHVGYPGDLTGGNRPTYQGGIALDGAWWQLDSHEAMAHRGDVWPGQSGGPLIGWWSNGPHAVAVQSSQNSNENNASGGQDMVDLIIKARAENP